MPTTQPIGGHMRAAGLSRFLVPVLMVLVLVLGATNVATVVSASSHNVAFGLVERALLIFGGKVAEAILARSPTREVDRKVREATADLVEENKKLASKNKQLTAQNAEIESRRVKASTDLDSLVRKRAADAAHAKKTAASVRSRLAKGLSRSIASIPAEAVPYIGIGVTLTVAALEVHDACATTNELNELMRLLGQGEEDADLCGMKVQKTAQVIASMKSQWQASADAVAREAKAVSNSIPVPVVRLPTANDAKTVICPVIGKTTWLAC